MNLDRLKLFSALLRIRSAVLSILYGSLDSGPDMHADEQGRWHKQQVAAQGLAAIPLLVELCGKSYQGIATQLFILFSLQGASPGLDNACTSQRQSKHMHSAWQDKVE